MMRGPGLAALRTGLAGVLLFVACMPSARADFSFETVEAAAQMLARSPYKPPSEKLEPALAQLDHARYSTIHYRPAARLWANTGTAFSISFFINGNAYPYAVKINQVDTTGVHAVPFAPGDFDLGDSQLDSKTLAKAGFSGFAVYTRVPDKSPGGDMVRVLEFRGATLFSGRGFAQSPGAGARGLAIDTGLLSGEEFPRFTEFWIERPAVSDKTLAIDALMESKRATGAYRFVVTPGKALKVEVRARIFLRDYVTLLGLAPINSMYLYGENDASNGTGDYRPEVHDSDGLQIHSGTGEWIWRPLVNPTRLLSTSFGMTNPQGFGLMQRDRRFSDYEDLKNRYDKKPSVWVTPESAWGTGRVQLVELPTPDQTHTNVVAFWVPTTPPTPGQPFDLAYRVEWQGDDQTHPPSAWALQTRIGHGFSPRPQQGVQFVVDFVGPALQALPPDVRPTGVVSVDSNGQLLEQRVVHNDATGGWRLFLRVKRRDDAKPLEMRAYLRDGNDTVTETWSYILPPS